MPKNTGLRGKRHNVYIKNDTWEKVELLNKFLPYEPNYSKIVKRSIEELFDKETRENKSLKIEWEKKKKQKKGKVISIKK